MSDIARGDRVRVEWVGTVTGVGSFDSTAITVRHESGGFYSVDRDDCTVIAPPVKVGDTIEDEQWMSLPDESVVKHLISGRIWQRFGPDLKAPGGDKVTVRYAAAWWRARVMDLPGQAA